MVGGPLGIFPAARLPRAEARRPCILMVFTKIND
jgi:hypothetical protein